MSSANSTAKKAHPFFFISLVSFFLLFCTAFALLLLSHFFHSKRLFYASVFSLAVAILSYLFWLIFYRPLIRSFLESDKMLSNFQDVISRDLQWEKNKRQAQYLALQNQINPHFLYNTLETIRSEALVAGLSTVSDMSESLANYFRYTITQTFEFVTLAEEIQNVRNYFFIQKFRFGDRVSLDIQIPSTDEFQMYRMPKLILQPIFENSLLHGLESKISGGVVKISAAFTDCGFYLYIEDNGTGMENEALTRLNMELSGSLVTDKKVENGGGIAIKNVNERIKLIYGAGYGLTYYSLPQVGTTVEISLPARYAK